MREVLQDLRPDYTFSYLPIELEIVHNAEKQIDNNIDVECVYKEMPFMLDDKLYQNPSHRVEEQKQ